MRWAGRAGEFYSGDPLKAVWSRIFMCVYVTPADAFSADFCLFGLTLCSSSSSVTVSCVPCGCSTSSTSRRHQPASVNWNCGGRPASWWPSPGASSSALLVPRSRHGCHELLVHVDHIFPPGSSFAGSARVPSVGFFSRCSFGGLLRHDIPPVSSRDPHSGGGSKRRGVLTGDR